MQHCLTMEQVEDLMLELTRLLLKMPDDNSTVRLAYGARSASGSAPMHDINKSVCYVSVNPADEGYGRQHQISYEEGEPGKFLTEVDEYTQEYEVIFSCYGDNSFEMARTVRDGLYGEKSKSFLHKEKFHFVTGASQIIQTREIFNTSWVRRCDFTALFYSWVRVERTDEMNWYEKAEITFKTEDNKNYIYPPDERST